MSAYPLLEYRVARVNEILSDIEAADGVIDPAQEQELEQLLHENKDAILDCAARSKELEAQAERLQEWRSRAHDKVKRINLQADRLRGLVRRGMEWYTSHAGAKTLKSPDDLVRVTLTAGKGRVEITDPALDRTHSIYGYKEEQVAACTIPRALFKAQVVWVLQTDMARSYLEEGKEIPGVRITKEDSVRIMIAGGGGEK